MNQLVPHDPARIDRGAIERIIRRAAELQAGAHDLGDGLSETELVQLGREVGIPAAYLQQALLEERTRSLVVDESGVAAWLAGPRLVVAQRTVNGAAERLRAGLQRWMTEGELLAVKRRYPDYTSWEQRHDVFSSIKRGFKLGGRQYHLAAAQEVVGQVSQVDENRCHVRLVADLANSRRSHVSGGLTVAGAGGVATLIGLTLAVALPVAILPVVLGAVAGFAIARRRRAQLERMQVALEQILDRLEHGEIQAPSGPTQTRPSAFGRIADEIRKNLGV